MKRFQNLLVYLAVLALSGAVTVKSVEPGKTPAQATVRSVTGTVTYSVNGGAEKTLKANMVLDAGATIMTGPDSDAYLSINGVSSAVHVQANTTLAIPTMDKIGAGRQGDTDTQLDLKVGTILGQVKKVAANSTYEIKTPHGVAGIRGTDFNVSVTALANGGYTVTFSCVQGTVLVSGINPQTGVVQTVTLQAGQSCTFTPASTSGTVPTVPEIQAALSTSINVLNQTVVNLFPGPAPTTTNPNGNPTTTTTPGGPLNGGVGTITAPFPGTGAPPSTTPPSGG